MLYNPARANAGSSGGVYLQSMRPAPKTFRPGRAPVHKNFQLRKKDPLENTSQAKFADELQ
jgi:hypothetical protein